MLARPAAPAVVFEGESLSYAELDARANQLAHHLVRHGVGPDVIVGVQLERSVELVVALLAVLKAGGAYLPLDPSYPADRRAFMVADARVPIVIARGPVDFGGRVIDLERDAAVIAAEPATRIDREPVADNLAYIIYTSGSTGRPKGVLVPHAQVMRLMSSTAAWFHFDERDVWTCVHSQAFDFSVWEIWGALMTGGSVVMVSERVRRAPDELLALIAAERVTVLNQIPSAFRHLIAAATRTPTPLALRLVIFGGEALELRNLAPWFERYPRAPQLVNMYGITETTVHVTYRPIDPAECLTTKGSPIGVPIPDLELHVLDGALHPADEGELYVGGAGLARGYHDRPALTATRFVPDPFSRAPGARLYKTGDLARRLPDGTFEYLGRNDTQVKIRGYRIETGEIAAQLNTHPAVREAAVVARGDGDDRRLVAYLATTAPVSTDELRTYLADTLPRFMIPSAFVRVDALPVTPSGKLDLNALPEPELAPRGVSDRDAPQGDDELAIASLMAELLHVERVGRHDNFIALGGHSLLAIQLVARLQAAFGLDVSLGRLLANPTVEWIASELARLRVTRARETRPIVAIPRDGVLPASYAQERMWFLESMLRDDDQRPFNVAIAIAIRGELDAAVLARSFTEVIARHESWRTNFRRVKRQLVHVIAPPFAVELPITEAGPLAGIERSRDLDARARAHARPPFDLANGRLVRAELVRFAPDDHVLLVAIHHIIYDGGSLGVFVRELAALYQQPAVLDPLAVQFSDIAHWQRHALSAEDEQHELAWWIAHLAESPTTEFPADRPRVATTDSPGARVDVFVPRALASETKAFAQREGATLFVTVVAALAVQLVRTGQTDLVIGTAVSSRDRPALENAPRLAARRAGVADRCRRRADVPRARASRARRGQRGVRAPARPVRKDRGGAQAQGRSRARTGVPDRDQPRHRAVAERARGTDLDGHRPRHRQRAVRARDRADRHGR